jgi:hypothetical protein
MNAVVTQPFMGTVDGEVYPRQFNVGDKVAGALAEVAIKEGWAVEGETLPDGVVAAPAVEIPENFRDLAAADAIALARKLGANEGVKTKAAALPFIAAEVELRSAAAEAPAAAKPETVEQPEA